MASTKPREIAEPKPGAGANLIAVSAARWNLSKIRSRSSGGMPLPSSTTCSLTFSASCQLWMQHGRLRRGIFGGVIEEIEQDLLEQHRIEHRALAGRVAMSTSTRWSARILLARSSSASPTISPMSCRAVLGLIEPRLEPRHVEQVGDEAVEPLGFLENGGDADRPWRRRRGRRTNPRARRRRRRWRRAASSDRARSR